MNRLSSYALTAIGFGFAAIGVLMVFTADTVDDRLMGAGCGLFSAACGLVGLFELLPRRPLDIGPDGRVVVRTSRLRTGILAFSGFAFLALGAVLARQAAEQGRTLKYVLAMSAVLFGLAVMLASGRQMISGAPLYAIDREGVERLSGATWRLAWQDIADIGIVSASTYRWVDLIPRAHVPPAPGGIPLIRRWVTTTAYTIQTSTTGVDFYALADHIIKLWRASRVSP